MKLRIIISLTFLTATFAACASVKTAMGLGSAQPETKSIQNPFGSFYSAQTDSNNSPLILRTKKGDRTVELQLPHEDNESTDFVIPLSPAFKDSERSPASGDSIDDSYKERRPTLADREITSKFPQGDPQDEKRQRDIENGLGLKAPENSAPERDTSYLASIDHVKQLYKLGRFEAGLLETDDLLREYPTDPKLYQMRGTLLDRVGKPEIALTAWKQALRFDPKNVSLQHFIERKEMKVGIHP